MERKLKKTQPMDAPQASSEASTRETIDASDVSNKRSDIRRLSTNDFAGRYRILRVLGSGAMGVVYLAQDLRLERRVAVKLVSAEQAADGQAGDRLRREARSLAALRHPHVVGVYELAELAEQPGAYYFVMEYVEGSDLEGILATHQASRITMPIDRAMKILGELADGLAAVHAAGIVHRDVKPANIIIEQKSGRSVLVDFGLADVALGNDTAGGTPAYSPLEQLLGAPASPAFGVYAFGVVAFEILTGSLPFDAQSWEHLIHLLKAAPIPAPSSLAPQLAAFDPVVARAMNRDASARYSSVAETYAQLQRAATGFMPCPMEAPSLHRGGVLVVDAATAGRELARRAVDTAFFWQPVELRYATSFEEATRQVSSRCPGLVILGAGMLTAASAKFLEFVRSLPGGSTMPVVALRGAERLPEFGRAYDLLPVRAVAREIVDALQRIQGTRRETG